MGYNSTSTMIPENGQTDLASINDYAAPPYLAIFGFDSQNPATGQCANFSITSYVSNYGAGVMDITGPTPYVYTYYIRNYIEQPSGSWQVFCFSVTQTSAGEFSELTAGCPNYFINNTGPDMVATMDALKATCP